MTELKTSGITEERIKKALGTVTKAIDSYGDIYWPIFDALKSELDALRTRKAQLAEFREPPNPHSIKEKTSAKPIQS